MIQAGSVRSRMGSRRGQIKASRQGLRMIQAVTAEISQKGIHAKINAIETIRSGTRTIQRISKFPYNFPSLILSQAKAYITAAANGYSATHVFPDSVLVSHPSKMIAAARMIFASFLMPLRLAQIGKRFKQNGGY